MDKVDYDYHTDPLFHAAVVAVTMREMHEQNAIRRAIQNEERPWYLNIPIEMQLP